jgi:hypothetical protein
MALTMEIAFSYVLTPIAHPLVEIEVGHLPVLQPGNACWA